MAKGFCRDCGSGVSSRDKFCPTCGVGWPMASNPLAVLSAAQTQKQTKRPQRSIQRRNSSEGVVPGVIGCVFAVLVIFTLGIPFVPIAAACSAVGMVLALTGRSGLGFGVSSVAAALTFAGALLSPSVWALVAGLALSH
jgi:hypothetical protein